MARRARAAAAHAADGAVLVSPAPLTQVASGARIIWRLNSGVPATDIAAWALAGHAHRGKAVIVAIGTANSGSCHAGTQLSVPPRAIINKVTSRSGSRPGRRV